MAQRMSLSGSARIDARASVVQSSRQFEMMEQLLSTDLMNHLKQEHEREIEALWEKQLMLREELARIVDLMQQEILPREKQMHDMIEKMQTAYESATKHLHSQLTEEAQKAGLSVAQRAQMQNLADPLQDMERELERIDKLLSHKIVTPDIQGWQPQTAAQQPRQQPQQQQWSVGRAQPTNQPPYQPSYQSQSNFPQPSYFSQQQQQQLTPRQQQQQQQVTPRQPQQVSPRQPISPPMNQFSPSTGGFQAQASSTTRTYSSSYAAGGSGSYVAGGSGAYPAGGGGSKYTAGVAYGARSGGTGTPGPWPGSPGIGGTGTPRGGGVAPSGNAGSRSTTPRSRVF